MRKNRTKVKTSRKNTVVKVTLSSEEEEMFIGWTLDSPEEFGWFRRSLVVSTGWSLCRSLRMQLDIFGKKPLKLHFNF